MTQRQADTRRGLVEAYRQGLGPRAAARLSEQQIRSDALIVAARVDAEVERLQRAGGLKSVNKSYRDYRIEAAACGERVRPYVAWLEDYKAELVREIATNLR
jgi:hypothetical protein